ncbi:hypothetical protein [Candidatus Nitrosocosmicus franklandus]|uniref:hypothetical protein n=1 Tax=Candidatus Nitrosocosmicus franklandianus TaxID=1798806 RepID=UPI0015596E42|nr:hypothetical protein [Candidatus Nitrosocosmicus franklandus]
MEDLNNTNTEGAKKHAEITQCMIASMNDQKGIGITHNYATSYHILVFYST